MLDNKRKKKNLNYTHTYTRTKTRTQLATKKNTQIMMNRKRSGEKNEQDLPHM